MLTVKNTAVHVLQLLIALSILSCNDEQQIPEQVSWIEANAYKPTSVDPANTDFADLQFLKTVIGDKRVVMLGEQSHGDGTTFLAKTRLIKFLHAEMGFDIIAFESGLYDCHKSWLEMKSGQNGIQSAKKAISKVWSHTSEVYPLFEYLDDAPYSLELIGMDPQFFGTYQQQLAIDLEMFLQDRSSATVNSIDWPDNKSLLTELLLVQNNPAALGETKLTEADVLIESLVAEISNFDQTPQNELLNDSGFWLQVLFNVKITSQINQLWQLGDLNGNLIRHEQMASNMEWILDRYPTRKIIVWAASTHIARNAEDAAYFDETTNDYTLFYGAGSKDMGDFLDKDYGSQIYAIGFTAYQGDFFNYLDFRNHKIEKPPIGSLEDFLNQTNEEYIFINYRGALPDWMESNFVSIVFAYYNTKNDWANSFDGIFYTRNMSASHYLP